MAAGYGLSAGEVLTLLDPNADKARDALKLTLTALLAQGVLRFETVTKKALLGTKSASVLVQARPLPARNAPTEAALQAIGTFGGGLAMDEVMKRLRKAFGNTLTGFRTRHLLPSLVGRGLVEARRESVLLVFKRTRHHLTTAGEQERERIEGLMTPARRIPSFLASDRAQALAIVAGLGSAVLLVEELKPYLGELGRTLTPDLGASFEFDFDASSMDSFGESLGSFDASFDSAADSGGSDGGGDGGGGGD